MDVNRDRQYSQRDVLGLSQWSFNIGLLVLFVGISVFIGIISAKANAINEAEAVAVLQSTVKSHYRSYKSPVNPQGFSRTLQLIHQASPISYLIIKNTGNPMRSYGFYFAGQQLVSVSNENLAQDKILQARTRQSALQHYHFSFIDNLGKPTHVQWALHKWRYGELSNAVWISLGLWLLIVIFSRPMWVRFDRRVRDKLAGALVRIVPDAELESLRLKSVESLSDQLLVQLAMSKNQADLALDELQNLNATLEARVSQRTAELRHTYNELKHTALHDPLTQLANRVLFNDRLFHAIEMGKRNDESFALVIVDIDNFKVINDTYGHMVGDDILKEVSRRYRRLLRKSDTIARLGGDEFAIILPDVDSETIDQLAKKIASVFHQKISVSDQTVEVKSSAGFALFPQHGQKPEELLRRADSAMYVAKRRSRDYIIFDIKEDEKRIEKQRLVKEFEIAINTGQLELHFQPIIDLSTGLVSGVEALCRWIHAERGFIPPDQFIAIAEKTKLIVPLTEWVIDTAIRQLANWHADGFKISVSVNLSAENFQDPKLSEKIMDQLLRYKVQPEFLYRLMILERVILRYRT